MSDEKSTLSEAMSSLENSVARLLSAHQDALDANAKFLPRLQSLTRAIQSALPQPTESAENTQPVNGESNDLDRTTWDGSSAQ
jgi:hypothetical protein